jgi:23S rRNA pseudouridine1911/1915/1917 synthase
MSSLAAKAVRSGVEDAGLHVLHAPGGERLDVFLAAALPSCSRSAARRLIEDGEVLVDGQVCTRPSQHLIAGQRVDARIPPPRPSSLVPEEMPLEIVYEDRDMVVLDKPSGLVVHPGAGNWSGTLVHGLLARWNEVSGVGGELRPGIVHRLDKDTSGLLMVAKNERAHEALSRQLELRTARKHYLALLRGAPRQAGGVIEAPIGRDPVNRQRMAVTERGRPARTVYRTLCFTGGYSLVVARLETGRTHQLRVHFAEVGCPIAGDPIYGNDRVGPAGRLWLHAWRLALDRPSDGRRLELEAPLPAELAASLDQMRDAAGERAGWRPPGELLVTARRWAAEAESVHAEKADK